MDLCRHNLIQAQNSARRDLARVWKLLEQCLLSSEDNLSVFLIFFIIYFIVFRNSRNCKNYTYQSSKFEMPLNALSARYKLNRTLWALHPFGRDLVNSL